MSLYGSLIAGVAGLKAQTQQMSTLSDNIANVNTVGYKKTSSYFSTLVTGAGSQSSYSPGGLRASPRPLIDQQGVLQSTQRATDVAVLGNGFLVVKTAIDETGEQVYTRAGSFSEDNQGRLVNGAGYFLQGWQLDQAGEITDVNTIDTVSVGTLNGVAVDTTTVEIGANLDATTTTSVAPWVGMTVAGFSLANATTLAGSAYAPDFRRALRVYDALGTSHGLSLSIQKTDTTNGWVFTISSTEAVEISGSTDVLAWGHLIFNGDGSIAALAMSSTTTAPATVAANGDGALLGTLDIDWTNGANDSQISFDFGSEDLTDGFSQFSSDNNIGFINQDGAEVGLRTGVYVDQDGYVVASFSNGATQRIWKLPVATFANANALEATNGNAYKQTDASGEFNLREANTGGAGRIEPAALEGSNVDLGEEFTSMITTQRAYSASARVITTADEMLDELLRVKR
jgi:flagellar hook protein FlgE